MATDSPKIHCDTILPTLVVPDVKATAEFYYGEAWIQAAVLLGRTADAHASCRFSEE